MGLTTFSTALSGLTANTMGLNVVGNNLANMNTVGYKVSNVSFTDVLGQTFNGPGTSKSGSSFNVGLGTQTGRVSMSFSQGGLEATGKATDVAIQGDGFFIVKDGGANFYTRAGNFQVDADGRFVNSAGLAVQGYLRNPTTGLINVNAGLQDIRMPAGLGNSTATSLMELAVNLDASAPVGTKYATTVQMYDSLGDVHLATVSFQKDTIGADSRWKFDVTVPHNEFTGIAATSTADFSLVTGAIATTPPAAGALVFDSNGKLKSSYTGADPAILPPAANLTIPPGAITVPLMSNGGKLAENGIQWKLIGDNGESNLTSFASSSIVTFNSQNGVPPGSMSSLVVQADGTVQGVFSNGLTQAVAQIGLGKFTNPNGLTSKGGSLFSETTASGTVLVVKPGESGTGRLAGGTLEQSNVDLAAEFTKIITFQRGYQANARIITTTDQILQETMDLKR